MRELVAVAVRDFDDAELLLVYSALRALAIEEDGNAAVTAWCGEIRAKIASVRREIGKA